MLVPYLYQLLPFKIRLESFYPKAFRTDWTKKNLSSSVIQRARGHPCKKFSGSKGRGKNSLRKKRLVFYSTFILKQETLFCSAFLMKSHPLNLVGPNFLHFLLACWLFLIVYVVVEFFGAWRSRQKVLRFSCRLRWLEGKICTCFLLPSNLVIL